MYALGLTIYIEACYRTALINNYQRGNTLTDSPDLRQWFAQEGLVPSERASYWDDRLSVGGRKQ